MKEPALAVGVMAGVEVYSLDLEPLAMDSAQKRTLG